MCLNLMKTLQINKVLKILRKIYTRDLEMRIVVMSKLILQSCKRWSKSSEEEIEKEVLEIKGVLYRYGGLKGGLKVSFRMGSY